MHNHGTALLDPPEAAPAPGWGELADLDYVTLAVALNASDMPDRKRPKQETAQLAEWARQGLGRLGLAEVRRMAARTRALGHLYAYGNLDAAGCGAEFRRMWPSARRLNTAHDYAYQLASDMRPPYWLARRRALGLAP